MKRGVELLNWAAEEARTVSVVSINSEDRNILAAKIAKAYLIGANDALHDEIDRIVVEGRESRDVQAKRDLQFSKAVHGR